ncbi:hypothetical protein GCM10010218_15750 [Streptomyces mashuensis]|uniref:Uncharacterized protein n=1 Tax=Streptomyces mashuensis TaxID=33904 RepID=A0A919B0I5_9ACTN|nr:hypothetical protein [Streptomyces mashuensis]GHF35364.1 hypothetical protein GCM10010218_15750 [Streptomyces mashuensis]
MADGQGQQGGGADKVLDIKTADIKAAAPVFQEQGKKLSDALTKLITTLDDLGKPWGKDDAGKDFEALYSPKQKHIEQKAGILVLGLVSIHEALNDLSDGHVDNEQLIKGMFTKLKPGEDPGHGGHGGNGGKGGK